MDAGASAIALATAAIHIAKRVYALYSKVKNAPKEIIDLLEEVQNIRIILNDIRNKEKLLAPWVDISAVSMVLRRATRHLEDSQKLLAQFVTQNDEGDLIFKRFDWYRRKGEIKEHSDGFRNIQLNALGVLGCAQL